VPGSPSHRNGGRSSAHVGLREQTRRKGMSAGAMYQHHFAAIQLAGWGFPDD
jgi:hypothetical protein